MNLVPQRVRDWLADPFGKRRVVEKHNAVIGNIHKTTERTKETTEFVYEHFPIGHMVGSQDLRRKRAHYVRKY